MRLIGTAVLAFLSLDAAAQGAPTVIENSGTLSYVYPLNLPPARGRYQPSLALLYGSGNATPDRGFGRGWALTTTYIERDTRFSPAALARDGADNRHWLVRDGSSALLVHTNGGTYRADVESSYFPLTFDNANPGTWTGTDALGSTYTFSCVTPACNRWYLTRVVDVDANVTGFAYLAEAGSSALLAEIHYNNFSFADGTGRQRDGTYASVVSLGYLDTTGLGLETVAGSFVDHRKRLDTVKVKTMGPGGLITTRSYRLSFPAANDAILDPSWLTSVTEFGGDLAQPLPAATFGYGAQGYSLAPGTTIPVPALGTAPGAPCIDGQRNALCSIPEAAAWIDLDGDGRPDLVWGNLWWARNVTTPGSPTLSFASAQSVATPSSAAPLKVGFLTPGGFVPGGESAATAVLRDFNGDGVPDIIVAPPATPAPPGTPCPWASTYSTSLQVFLGNSDRAGHVTYPDAAHALVVDTTAIQCRAAESPSYLGNVVQQANVLQLEDVNGDGILDYSVLGSVWLGSITSGSPQVLTFTLATASYWVPGAPLADLNGDGLLDHYGFAGVNGTPPLQALLNAGASQVPVIMSSDPTLFPFDTHPVYSQTGCGTVPFVPDTMVAFADIDGDGLMDYVRKVPAITNGPYNRDELCGASLCPMEWLRNTGRQFAAGVALGLPNGGNQLLPMPTFTGPSGPVAASLYPSMTRQKWQQCKPSGKAAVKTLLGDNGLFIDADGDGVVDYVQFQSSGAWLYYRGIKTDGTNPNLLRAVTTPLGAVYTVAYAPATGFGGVPAPRAVVKSVTITGPALAPNTVNYWYAGPVLVQSWDDSARMEDRGFRESWAMDDVTKVVVHKTWGVDSHAWAGALTAVESGAMGTAGSGFAHPTIDTTLDREQGATAFGHKKVGDSSCASGLEPPVDEYPVMAIPTLSSQTRIIGGASFTSSSAIACENVDQYGNVLTTTRDPDTSIPGNESETRRLFGAPVCVSCPTQVTTLAASGGAVLGNQVFEYDALGHLVHSYSVGGTFTQFATTNEVNRTYQGNGLLSSETRGGVTTTHLYDSYQLRPVEEFTWEPANGKVLVTNRAYYDDGSVNQGRLLWTSTPFVSSGTTFGHTCAGTNCAKKYLAYDPIGRVVAVTRAPIPVSGALAPPVLGVTRYFEAERPARVVQYGITSDDPTVVVSIASPPTTSAFTETTTFLDGLGRTIQTRELLGTGVLAGTSVTQALTGYRVSGSVILDGAGRARAVLDPYYVASGSGYRDPRSIADWGTAKIGAAVTTYDALSRPVCVARVPVVAVNPAPLPAGSCLSSGPGNDDSTSFVLATGTRYGSQVLDAPYVMVETITPDRNVATVKPGFKTLADASGNVAATIDPQGSGVVFTRDPLARVTRTVRRADVTSPAGEIQTTAAFNQAGQAYERFDASSGTRRTWFDPTGRAYLTELWGTNKVLVGRIATAFGDLGRPTEVRYCQPAGGCNAADATSTVAGSYVYDTAYADGSNPSPYHFTAGRLSYAANAQATVAFGYDLEGRSAVRREWFVGGVPGSSVPSIGPFDATWSYGNDGRLTLASTGSVKTDGSAYGATLSYAPSYDSAGRPIKLAGGGTTFWQAAGTLPTGGGYYDALGRIPTVKADVNPDGSGGATTTRFYGLYSGALLKDVKMTSAGELFHVEGTTYTGSKVAGYTDKTSGAGSTAFTFGYHSAGQLSSVAATPSGPTDSLTQSFSEQYSFRADNALQDGATLGNLEKVSRTSGGTTTTHDYQPALDPNTSPPPPVPGDQLGKMVISPAQASTGVERLAYDLGDHLLSVARTIGASENLWYGPMGELVMRQQGVDLTWYAGAFATVRAKLPSTCQTAGCPADPASLTVDAHVLLGTTRIASVKSRKVGTTYPISQTLYYFRDRQGSVVATSTAGGAIGVKLRYGPYGAVEKVVGATAVNGDPCPVSTASTTTACPDLGYTGALRLSGGLLYLSARVYDTGLRRFLSADSVDPRRYAYTGGDPANNADLSGMFPIENPMTPIRESQINPNFLVSVEWLGKTTSGSNWGNPEISRAAVKYFGSVQAAEAFRASLGSPTTDTSPGNFEGIESAAMNQGLEDNGGVPIEIWVLPSQGVAFLITKDGGWSFKIRSGSPTYDPLDAGAYWLVPDSLRNRSAGRLDANAGMQDENGVGWSIDLVPDPGTNQTERDLLRFHPDGDGTGKGNFNNGTQGCVGINTANSQEFLNRFLGAVREAGYPILVPVHVLP